ncbi:MAG: folylpolyglutamate synthase/dihydrofolate synthase family protein [Candidatus Bipolaricaulia bacterium]
MDYEEARDVLDRLPTLEVKPGLERVDRLLDVLGRPERAYPAIHVGGTNGKGSVVAMLDAVLRSAGYRVGRFTSPAVVDFRERITIDDSWLSEADWAAGVERIAPALADASDPPAQFEAVTAIAFDAFRRHAVDVAIVEVGLGGRFDATNRVEPILAILTNVSYDHTAILGETLERIAWEKVGIAKRGVPFLTGPLPEGVEMIVEKECADVGAVLEKSEGLDVSLASEGAKTVEYRVAAAGFPDRIDLSLLGGYQEENLRISLRAIELLREGGFDVPASAVREGLRTVSWPGRFEIVRRSPTVILEGAHNVAGARALADDIERYAPDRARRHLVFGSLADKDVAGMLGVLVLAFSDVALTQSTSPRALPVEELARLMGEVPIPFACYDSVEGALAVCLPSSGAEDVWVVAGSLTVVAEARRYLEGER